MRLRATFGINLATAVGLVCCSLCGCIDPAHSISANTPMEPTSSTTTPTQPTTTTPTTLGATFSEVGTTFRVWAPDAEKIFVAGTFNNFSLDTDELVKDTNNVFSLTLKSAQPGDRYRFVIQKWGEQYLRADPRARQIDPTIGDSVIVDPSTFHFTPFSPPPIAQQVVYELHVGTYNPATGAVGTFNDVVARLDHISDLGVNMIELMPVAQFPGDHSWGYNPSHPFAVDNTYGTPTELRALIEAAHARGIGVIIDVVHNHWGPTLPSLWCFDGDCLGDQNGGVYFFTDSRLDTPWGPRPNYEVPQVEQYILDNATMWLTEYNADGLRWDSTVNIRQDNTVTIVAGMQLLQDMNAMSKALSPAKIQIAEDLQNWDGMTDPANGGFDTQWDGSFNYAIDTAVITTNDADRDLESIAAGLALRMNGRSTSRVVYSEDHDSAGNSNTRVPSMITPSDPGSWYARKRSTLAAVVTFFAPGVPMILQGQEFLESGAFSDASPLDWSKLTKFSGVYALYQDLIHTRTTLSAAGIGDIDVFHVNDVAKVIAFRRFIANQPGSDVIVIANFSNVTFTSYALPFPNTGAWQVRLDSDSQNYSSDYGGQAQSVVNTHLQNGSLTGSVNLAPYTALVLTQN